MKPLTLRQIKNEIHRLDPDLQPVDEAYDVATILLSALVVGPNIRRIARFAGLTYRFITDVSYRLRTNGIWRGAKTVCNWIGKNDGLEFWLDVNVGLGYLEKV